MDATQATVEFSFFNQWLMNIVSSVPIIPEDFHWLGLLFCIFVIVFAVNICCRIIVGRVLSNLVKSDKTIFDQTTVNAFKKPLYAFVNFAGLLWMAQALAEYKGQNFDHQLSLIWSLGLVVIVGWFLFRLIRALELNLINNSKKKDSQSDKATVIAIGRLLRFTVLIIMTLIVLQTLGFSISGVLAFGGVGGIAVGFAAKDLLANFFGGLMIFVDKPFHVGDWISSPDRQIEGTVENIGWRMTRIRTFDLRPLYIPNSAFMSISVENPSRMLHRRISENIGLRYEDASVVNEVVDDIKKMLKTHPDIEQDQTIIVAFDKFAASSLEIKLYCFTKTTNWVEFYTIKQKVLLEIEEIVHKHHADFAFPTQQLFMTEVAENQPSEDVLTK